MLNEEEILPRKQIKMNGKQMNLSNQTGMNEFMKKMPI